MNPFEWEYGDKIPFKKYTSDDPIKCYLQLLSSFGVSKSDLKNEAKMFKTDSITNNNITYITGHDGWKFIITPTKITDQKIINITDTW